MTEHFGLGGLVPRDGERGVPAAIVDTLDPATLATTVRRSVGWVIEEARLLDALIVVEGDGVLPDTRYLIAKSALREITRRAQPHREERT
jgi:hypothetical protein